MSRMPHTIVLFYDMSSVIMEWNEKLVQALAYSPGNVSPCDVMSAAVQRCLRPVFSALMFTC